MQLEIPKVSEWSCNDLVKIFAFFCNSTEIIVDVPHSVEVTGGDSNGHGGHMKRVEHFNHCLSIGNH